MKRSQKPPESFKFLENGRKSIEFSKEESGGETSEISSEKSKIIENFSENISKNIENDISYEDDLPPMRQPPSISESDDVKIYEGISPEKDEKITQKSQFQGDF